MSKLLYITIVLLCIWLVWSNKYEHYTSYDKNTYIHNVQLIESLKKDIKIYNVLLATNRCCIAKANIVKKN